jgi:soluble lytic murein transglycosylase
VKSFGSRRAIGAWLILGVVAAAGTGIEARRAGQGGAAARPLPASLAAPARPVIPSDPARFWLVPSSAGSASLARPAAELAAALRDLADSKPASALPKLELIARTGSPLATYVAYYRGLCLLALARPAEARTLFARLHASTGTTGFIAEASIGYEAEAAAASGDHAAAIRLYEELLARKPATPDALLAALGHELFASGDRARAAETFSRLYFEFPLSDQAADAASTFEMLQDALPARDAATRSRLELDRAERLFAGKRYPAAKEAFAALEPSATGDLAELVTLRLAECDHFLHRDRQARDRLAPLVEHATREIEVKFFWLTATRETGNRDEYVRLAREFITAYPDSSWAEEALNNLATHFILVDEDEQADAVFRELYTKFPKGPHAERAAWRAGWWAYSHGHPQETIAFYEGAASTFPRSDYRPAYLYWTARSRELVGDTQGAASIYRLLMGDYLNSYYGRLASRRPVVTGSAVPSPAVPATAAAPPPTAGLIRLLLSLKLYEPARDELLYAQRTWGDSPAIGATLGFAYNKLGDYRRGITWMKRAYPQYIGPEGAHMPVEAMKVIFPLDYWPLIRKYAAASHLDPYMIAALINQESAFDARIKSSAGAIGLMQVLPSTGRQYARKLRIRRFSTLSLTRPETNIQIGVAFFADVVARAGGVHFALASYNAGEQHVREWNEERGRLETEEYVDGIPFPETQTYVKRIIGTTEDYRRIYGEPVGTATMGKEEVRGTK